MASAVLQEIIAAKRANPYGPKKTVAELRAQSDKGAAEPLPDGATFEVINANGVPAEWIEGAGARHDRTFLFIHGGGYYRGSVAASRATAARISAATGARVLSTSYRLAPEHSFPAAIDDVHSAYRWLLSENVDPSRLMVGGISAGGGLTLALLLKLKEASDPQPAGAVPMSAWTDMTQTAATYLTKADEDPSISKIYLDRMSGYYLNGADPKTPLASPLFGDLSGLPPLLVQVGTAETLLDDSRLFAERAEAAGVDVVYQPWDDMIHGWHGSARVLPEAQEAIDSIGDFFKSHVS
ncbi:MAG: alpha/beta hydrolase fold domain-containing protein [Alphaproteobacteria bacterium]|nr:alpha/beta hydrolase fold domain-containing protein [Alphaproteobacteria bacterium]